MKNTLAKTLTIAALFTAFLSSGYASIQTTGACYYIQGDRSYGDVLKIGYKGAGYAVVPENTVWDTNYNVLVGCCPDATPHATFHVYGTANTRSVYVSGKIRDGECYVVGGTWNCNGLFYLGQITPGILSISKNGALSVSDTFYMNYGSTVSVDETSSLTLRLEADGTFGTDGGIHVFNDLGGKIALADASALIINADSLIEKTSAYSQTLPQDEIILGDFITVEKKYAKYLSTLVFSVGGNTFTADKEDELNRHLSGIVVEGFEDYAKRFVVDSENQTVALHLSKIPEPSAFGLIAGTFAVAIAISRRRRK